MQTQRGLQEYEKVGKQISLVQSVVDTANCQKCTDYYAQFGRADSLVKYPRDKRQVGLTVPVVGPIQDDDEIMRNNMEGARRGHGLVNKYISEDMHVLIAEDNNVFQALNPNQPLCIHQSHFLSTLS